MANKIEISALLYSRFESVPGLSMGDTNAAIDEAIFIFELDEMDIRSEDVYKVLTYTSAEVAMKIAFNTASYFKFTDGEEAIDKSMVSDNYRKLAREYRSQYENMTRKEERKATATFTNRHRIDRPPFLE